MINNEDILKLAQSVYINLDEEQVEEIKNTIENVRLDLDNIDVNNNERKIMGNSQLSNVFSTNNNEIENSKDILKAMNNVENDFVIVTNVESGNDES